MVHRSIQVDGASKSDLLARLEQAGIHVNSLGRELFAHPRFNTSPAGHLLVATQLTVSELGFPSGATFAEIIVAATSKGLSPCELEVAAHFRLQFTDQAEGGQCSSPKQAPAGSITVCSLPISEDDDEPKGFYLRRIDGVLWLRGYRSWAGHVWNAHDEFLFAGYAA